MTLSITYYWSNGPHFIYVHMLNLHKYYYGEADIADTNKSNIANHKQAVITTATTTAMLY